MTTAFINTDGTVAVVVLNNTDEEISYRLYIGGKASVVKALPHSICTFMVQDI